MSASALRVLVVDDCEPWRGFVCSTLRAQGKFQVIGEAADGFEAVQLAGALRPDLVLLDIGIPGLNGIEVAKQICQSAPSPKILFLTGIASPGIAEAALQTGASGYVVKFDAASELIPAINAVLGGSSFIGRGIKRLSPEAESATFPARKGSPIRQSGHVVQFYENDADLADSLCVLVRDALGAGAAAIGILTDSHWTRLENRLLADGVDLQAARKSDRLMMLDAVETLGPLMDANGLKRETARLQFWQIIRRAQGAAVSKDIPVVIFGEMVVVLWAQRKYDAAMELEQLANELASAHGVYICCPYPASEFQDDSVGAQYAAICAEHSQVVPAF